MTASIHYIIPSLNGGKTLRATLASLKSQREYNVGIIVVDSGSTDETHEICRSQSVKLLYADPGNMYKAINIGIRTAESEWVGYINCDDFLYDDAVARLIPAGESNGADLVYGDCDFVDVKGRFLASYRACNPTEMSAIHRMKRTGFAQPTALFRKSLFNALGGFSESYRFCADTDFFVRAANSHKLAKARGGPIACFRLHENQLSAKNASVMDSETERIFAKMRKSTLLDRLRYFSYKLANADNYMLRTLRRRSMTN